MFDRVLYMLLNFIETNKKKKKLYYIFPEMGLVILSKEDGKNKKTKTPE